MNKETREYIEIKSAEDFPLFIAVLAETLLCHAEVIDAEEGSTERYWQARKKGNFLKAVAGVLSGVTDIRRINYDLIEEEGRLNIYRGGKA